MYISTTLSVLYFAALAIGQTTTDVYSGYAPDYGLTPSQTDAIISAESSIIESLEANPTFASVVSALEAAFPSTDPFEQIEKDFAGDGYHLPTGTSARAAIASDINAMPTSGGIRSFFQALETLAYSELDAILGIAAVTVTSTSSSSSASKTQSAATTTATTTSTSAAAAAGTSSSSSTSAGSAPNAVANAGPTVGAMGALGGAAVLGAVMAIL